MALLIGALLALAVGGMATSTGLDRDRAFYPTVTIVIASYYLLFAVISGSNQALVIEAMVGTSFIAVAVAGFRSSLWLVVAALVAHGVFDFFRADVIDNPGVPTWWPQFCLTFDITAAGYLAWLLRSGRTQIRPVRDDSGRGTCRRE